MAEVAESVESTILADYRHGGSVAVLTLNRPHVLNAMSTEMGLRLNQLMEEVSEQARVRVVVLTGAGERAFCAGGDLKQRMGMTQEQWVHQHRIFEAAHQRLRWLRKPVFAAVNGIAVGGGCEMAMSTDFIICSENARFGQPEVSRGIMPGAGGTQLLPRRRSAGVRPAVLGFGLRFDFAYAHEKKARFRANYFYTTAGLSAVFRRVAMKIPSIAANSPAAVQQAKRAARMGLEQPIEQAIEIELECYRRMVDHPDRFEGVAAFNERRKPEFQDCY